MQGLAVFWHAFGSSLESHPKQCHARVLDPPSSSPQGCSSSRNYISFVTTTRTIPVEAMPTAAIVSFLEGGKK